MVPSAIGGDREKRTGVILAKSIPAKRFNIITGEPVALALRKCPNLFLARPDFQLYERNSKAFMDICRKYTPVVEKYSIDECFMDISGMGKIFTDPAEAAKELKDEIWNTLGFTVNVGISSKKILAKMASDFEKPGKVHTLYPEEIESKLWPLPVRALFTVGKAAEERLKRINISNIGELAKADIRLIQATIGEKAGRQIHEYANGIDDSPVLSEADEAKGFSCSTTLSEDVVASEEAYKILLSLTDTATSRMRAEGVKAYCVSVTVRSSDFKDKSHQRALNEPTDITTQIYNLSKNLFDELWDGRTPLRLLGVSLTDLTKEGEIQQTLFRDREKERQRELDKAMDNIRSKYGSDKVSWGSTLHTEE
ncbi:DNA polymerase IV [Bacillota bacterium]